MPLFAFEDGRALPLPAHPRDARTWDGDTFAAIRGAVLDLVEVPLLPIAWRLDDAVLEDYLVALDATGAAVVVVARGELDGETLVAALARSARVRSASWREVATWYDGGSDRLREDWAVFREGLPPRGEPAPGLLVVTGDIHPAVRSAIEVLDSATVTVHEVASREQDGRAVLAVEPVAVRFAARHQVLEIEAGDGVADVALLGGVTAAPVPAAGDVTPDVAGDVMPDVAGDAMPDVTGDAMPDSRAESSSPESSSSEPSSSEPEPASASEPATADREESTDPVRRRRAHRGAEAVPEPGSDGLAAVVALVGESELVLDGSGGAVRALLTDAPALLVSGVSYADPTAAAAAITGRAVADGWAAWRFGESGPFLGEALEEALHPSRVPARPRRRRAVRR